MAARKRIIHRHNPGFLKLRHRLDLSQREMALKLMVSTSAIQQYEQGRMLPSGKTIARIFKMWPNTPLIDLVTVCKGGPEGWRKRNGYACRQGNWKGTRL